MSENTNTNSFEGPKPLQMGTSRSVGEEENSVQFVDIVASVWANKWWYVLSVCLCLIFGVFYLYRTQKTYERTMKVLVDESEQKSALSSLGLEMSGVLKGTNTVNNEMEAFSSPDLMQAIVRRLGLETSYVEDQLFRKVELYQNKPVEMKLAGDNPSSSFSFHVHSSSEKLVLSDFRIKKDEFKDRVEAAFGDTVQTPVGKMVFYPTEHFNAEEGLKHHLTISWRNSMSVAKSYCSRLNISLSQKQSSVVSFTLKDAYPERANAILTSLIDVYNETWISNQNRASVNTSEFINDRLVIIEKDLQSVEESLRQYKEAHQLADIKTSANTYIQESSQYSAKAFEINN
ncbi:MAG: Wzz/FepE/Etk N-terminal domain-containing protein, partial [Candidatus Cryptobacteroides sp.]